MANKLSPGGVGFLKCAFAPADFNVEPGQGIPDDYQGQIMVRKEQITQTFNFPPGKTIWVLVLPTPSIAYWILETNAGTNPAPTDTFQGINYSGAANIFPTADPAQNVSAFRYASMAAGFYPTSSLTNTAGSITTWKASVKWSTSTYARAIATIPPTNLSLTAETIVGLDSVLFTGKDNFATGFANGAYVTSANADAVFPWQTVRENKSIMPASGVTTSQAGMPFTLQAQGNLPIVGCEGMDAIIFKIETPVGSASSAIFKSWACIEYRPTSLGVFDNHSVKSPPYDPLAIELYRKIAVSLPPGVRCMDNATMWERVRSMITGMLGVGRDVARIATYVPGPIGVAAHHVTGLADLLSNLGL